MELTQLLPLKKWSAIESDLYEKYHIQGSVFNTDGSRITDTKNWSNQLCPAIKSTDKGQSFICAVAHMNMANLSMNTKAPVIQECDAGLLKLVVPIFFDDQYLGVISGCGLLSIGCEVDHFAINKIAEIDEQTIQTLSSDVPTITYEKVNSICKDIKKKLKNIYTDYKK